MNVSPVAIVHLVELIDAADASIGQHESTAFEDELASHWVLEHGSCETDSRATLASRVDAARGEVRDVLQQLRFGNTWVAHEKHVDIAPDLHPVVHLLGQTAYHEYQESHLDFFHAEDLRADGLRQAAHQVVVALTGALDVHDTLHPLLRQHHILKVLLLFSDLKGLHEGVLEETSPLETICRLGHEDASDINHVARGAASSDLTSGNYLDHPGHVADRDLVARLLNLDILIGDKPRRLDLKDELAIDAICLTLVAGALHDWVEFF